MVSLPAGAVVAHVQILSRLQRAPTGVYKRIRWAPSAGSVRAYHTARGNRLQYRRFPREEVQSAGPQASESNAIAPIPSSIPITWMVLTRS